MTNRITTKKKINKSERIEFRCSKAFKVTLQEIATSEGMTLSALVELLCTDKITSKRTDKPKLTHTDKSTSKVDIEKTDKDDQLNLGLGDIEHKDYEVEIWRLYNNGVTPTNTAKWLNDNGFKPQRGAEFTLSSVNSIRRRLKKQAQYN